MQPKQSLHSLRSGRDAGTGIVNIRTPLQDYNRPIPGGRNNHISNPFNRLDLSCLSSSASSSVPVNSAPQRDRLERTGQILEEALRIVGDIDLACPEDAHKSKD